MSVLHTLLHFTWCLPQTLLGLIIRGCGYTHKVYLGNEYVFGVPWLKSGLFSLGRYIFTPSTLTRCEMSIILHEEGHSDQSLILGWLYLPVIAIPSVCWFYLHKWCKLKCSYYWFYTERWANKLAGVNIE